MKGGVAQGVEAFVYGNEMGAFTANLHKYTQEIGLRTGVAAVAKQEDVPFI